MPLSPATCHPTPRSSVSPAASSFRTAPTSPRSPPPRSWTNPSAAPTPWANSSAAPLPNSKTSSAALKLPKKTSTPTASSTSSSTPARSPSWKSSTNCASAPTKTWAAKASKGHREILSYDGRVTRQPLYARLIHNKFVDSQTNTRHNRGSTHFYSATKGWSAVLTRILTATLLVSTLSTGALPSTAAPPPTKSKSTQAKPKPAPPLSPQTPIKLVVPTVPIGESLRQDLLVAASAGDLDRV